MNVKILTVVATLVALVAADPIGHSAFTAVGTCPSKDTGVPVFLADDTNCTVYYECSNGRPIKNYCNADLEFSPITNVCDYPWRAGCEASNSNAKKVLANKPLSAVGTCPPKDTGVAVFLADDTDCDVYYECSNGVPIRNVCNAGLEFSPTTNVCDYPWRAGCEASNSNAKKPLANKPLTAVGTCPPKDTGVAVFLADDTDCDVYYECSNGVPIRNVCNAGLEFSPTTNVCDYPWRAGCEASGSTLKKK